MYGKEIIGLYEILSERFPNVVNYKNQIEKIDPDVDIVSPVGGFFVEVMEKLGFLISSNTLSESPKKSRKSVRVYEYENADNQDVSVEAKIIKLTKKVREKYGKKLNKFNKVLCPNGSEYATIFTVWSDNGTDFLDEEYTTQSEIEFCKYMLMRDKVVGFMSASKFKKKGSRFSRRNIVVKSSDGFESFDVYAKNEDKFKKIFSGSYSKMNRVIKEVDEKSLWKSDYSEIKKKLKGVLK